MSGERCNTLLFNDRRCILPFDHFGPCRTPATSPESPPSGTDYRAQHIANLSRIGLTPDVLGEMVRDAWVRWAKRQPDPKPHWLVPWAGLNETDRDADREIGRAVALFAIAHHAADVPNPPPSGTDMQISLQDVELQPGEHVVRHPNGHLMIERRPPYVPSADEIATVLQSLGKAYPYLVDHAPHIDGEFDIALTETRRMFAAFRQMIAFQDAPTNPPPSGEGERERRTYQDGVEDFFTAISDVADALDILDNGPNEPMRRRSLHAVAVPMNLILRAMSAVLEPPPSSSGRESDNA